MTPPSIEMMHSFQVHKEHLPKWSIYWTIKHVSTNSKGLKSYSEYYSDYNGIKWEIKKKKICGRLPNISKLNNVLLSYLEVQEEFTREVRKYFELNEN